ncbi:MAG: PC4/YdbC family ssDNA-binding protein [Bacillota bacterium]
MSVAVNYEIKKQLAILSETKSGWTKELNLVSWNGREAKYDIRDWAPDKERMSKGITLSEDEILALKEALNIIFDK